MDPTLQRTRTKIIATIGPASQSYETLDAMIRHGMDVARMNFSHGIHENHQTTIDNIRRFNKEKNSNICLLGDLQGPKLRVGTVLEDPVTKKEEITLESGRTIYLTSQNCICTPEKLFISYDHLAQDVQPGEKILLDDGKLELEVISTDLKYTVETKIIHGGKLSSNKGVNFPHSNLSTPAISEKDEKDLLFALKNDVEWIALSFVRTANDIVGLKKIIAANKSNARVIAKIEKPEAITNITEIIGVADCIMVARGDLGVEMDLELVPILQKKIVRECIDAAKPVIIATQMMESMIHSATPTRAEANDVTNAVLDGADAVMLSAETSVGDYPVEVVKIMNKIVTVAETQDAVYNRRNYVSTESKSFLTDEICHQACSMCKELGAKAIVSMTHSGYTAFQLASFRPHAPIFIFTDNHHLLNMVNMIWGVRAFYYNKFATTDETIRDVNGLLHSLGYVQRDDLVINTASMPIVERSKTNTIKVSRIE